MLSITLKQLEIFTAVAETSSFSKAGEMLSFSQSTISLNISLLEDATGRELFDRNNKKNVILTDDGRAFYTHAKSILSSCYSLQNNSIGGNANAISIGAHYIPARYILPDVMANYHSLHPNARFTLKEGQTQELLNLLTLRKIDLCYTTEPTEDKTLRCKSIYWDPFVLAFPKTPFYERILESGSSSLTLLQTCPVVWNESTEEAVSHYLATLGLCKSDLNIIAEVNEELTARNATMEGLGISFLSRISLKCVHRMGDILFMDLEGSPIGQNIYAITRRSTTPDIPNKEFSDFLESQRDIFETCNH